MEKAKPYLLAESRFNKREWLIDAAIDFVRKVSIVPGVSRVAFLGSLTTNKSNPKDADVLVTINEQADIEVISKLGRSLKGKTQQINRGADIFLANTSHDYLGRTCNWRECRPRAACHGTNCWKLPGEGVPFLMDDLQEITLKRELIEQPPVVVYPELMLNQVLPKDLRVKIEKAFLDYPENA
jgi:hypothetical protein